MLRRGHVHGAGVPLVDHWAGDVRAHRHDAAAALRELVTGLGIAGAYPVAAMVARLAARRRTMPVAVVHLTAAAAAVVGAPAQIVGAGGWSVSTPLAGPIAAATATAGACHRGHQQQEPKRALQHDRPPGGVQIHFKEALAEPAVLALIGPENWQNREIRRNRAPRGDRSGRINLPRLPTPRDFPLAAPTGIFADHLAIVVRVPQPSPSRCR